MEKNKKLLIIERVCEDLQICENTTTSENIYLEGIFTEFKVRNRNGRIYEASDFIPKMNELLPKVANHTLLGELDHPTNFDVSLKNASHVIEKLEYDKANNRVIGKIRLLNTDAGKQAQALVRDGIPLHISSRAAGNINPSTGQVTLEKLFTYDLVADPGFENAELKRVNEAYGYGDMDNVYIFEYESNEPEKNTIENMNTVNENNSVKVADFQKYTEYIAGILENLKASVSELKSHIGSVNENASAGDLDLRLSEINNMKSYMNYLAQQIQKTANHSDYLAEQLQKTSDHSDYLAESIENAINYSEYVAEQVDKTIKHSDYLAEKLEQNFAHNDYLAEKLEQNFSHNDYLAEKLEQNFKHNDYLAEKLEQNFAHNDYLAERLQKNYDHNDYLAETVSSISEYSDYLAEQLQKNSDHNDYLAEKLEQNFKHNDYLAEKLNENFAHNDYLAEKLNQNFKHNDYLAEQLENTANKTDYICEHASVKPMQFLNENKTYKTQFNVESNDAYKSAITEKLDALIKKQDAQVPENNFLSLLSENRQNEFNRLDSDTQEMISKAMKTACVRNEAQANMIWKSVYESKKGLDVVENMPEICREKWNALSDKRKAEILNEAKFYNLKTTNEINHFWATRDLREATMVVERVDTDSAKTWNRDIKEQDDHISGILNRTKKGIRGF